MMTGIDYDNYEEKLDLENEYVREKLEYIYDQVRSWAAHNKFEVIELDEGVEVKLPYNHLLHVDPFEIYVTGTSNAEEHGKYQKEIKKDGIVIRSYNKHTNSDIISSKPARKAMATLDCDHGALSVGRELLTEYVQIVTYKKAEEYQNNWEDMSPHERKKKIEKMPKSHHRKILLEELDSAGIKVPGFTD